MAKERNKTKTTAKPRANASASQSARTAERRKVRERERRRQQIITGGIIAVALIAVVVFIVLIVRAPAEAPIPEASLTRYDGITQTRTEDGYPRLGDASEPVQVAEFSSFDCTHCRDFHAEMIGELVNRVKDGFMALTYVPLYGYGSLPNGQGAAIAAVCAADQGKFWQFHDALFDWNGQYGVQAFTNNRILSGVDALGLNRSQYDSCIGSGTTSDILAAARSQAGALLNFSGTPTITVNGVVPTDDKQQPLTDYTAILAYIDGEIERAKSLYAPATPEATSEATVEATPETEAGMMVEPAVEATAEVTPEATEAVTPEMTAEATAAS